MAGVGSEVWQKAGEGWPETVGLEAGVGAPGVGPLLR